MRFTDQFGVQPNLPDDDWFDLECAEDTPLYVDPFLVFDDPDPFWSSAHQEVIDFFALALKYVMQAQGDRNSVHWMKAERMLMFPEPKEFALGVSMGHPVGSGTGSEFATRMVEALDVLRRDDIDTVQFVEVFILFVDRMGMDRISDVFCNIIKAKLIEYTKQVVTRHRIPTQRVPVRHASWSKTSGRWNDSAVALPKSPVTDGGVLLVPRRFLKDIPRVSPQDFWTWAEVNENETLRRDLNYDLAVALTEQDKISEARKLARRRPDMALRYVQEQADKDHEPYDTEDDPKLLVGWAEVGREAAAASPTIVGEPATQDEILDWVTRLAVEFKERVEQTDLWRTLWNDGYRKPRRETIIQSIAGAMWTAQCRASNVDMSKEANMGKGPVDFKFSKGWELRVLLEIKRMDSKQFVHGAETQLPQYLRTEKVHGGVYVAIGFTDEDFSQERQDKVRDACKAMTERKGMPIVPVFVDARANNKPSASKKESDPEG